MSYLESISLTKTLPCLAEHGKIIVIGKPSQPLSDAIPCLATLPGVIAYNPETLTPTFRRQPGFMTLYPDKVYITQARDFEEGLELLKALTDAINATWEHRSELVAATTARHAPRWLDILTMLPQTNCKQCGEATCMAFAAALLQQKRWINECLPLVSDAEYSTTDILVGETSTYADYIFPDLSFLERWELHGSHPSVPWKVETIRQPAISLPGWPTVKVYGEEIPLSFEALLLGLAEKLELTGFGPDGLGEGVPYTRPEHYYLKMVADVAFDEKEDGSDNVPEADDEEVRIFMEARRHLPKPVFDLETWKAAVGGDESLWRKVIFVLNRGGHFQDFAKGYKGEQVANKYGRLINLYQENTATSINTMTGKAFPGYTTYIPAGLSSTGEEIKDDGYDFNMITFKVITMTKARTITNYWLTAVQSEGYVLMNRSDADSLGIQDGDTVRLSSASNPDGVRDVKGGRKVPMEGKAKVVEGLRPGVVALPLGYGHWASGAADITIDDIVVRGDARRAAPLHGNAAMRVDPVLGNVTLSDLAGGSAVFYDTKVKVTRV